MEDLMMFLILVISGIIGYRLICLLEKLFDRHGAGRMKP